MAKNKSKKVIRSNKTLTEYSKLLKMAGRLQFKKVYQPTNGEILMSLDIDNPWKPLDLKKWYFHILFARRDGHDHSHDHFLLSIKQARQVHKYLSKLISLHDSTKKSSRRYG